MRNIFDEPTNNRWNHKLHHHKDTIENKNAIYDDGWFFRSQNELDFFQFLKKNKWDTIVKVNQKCMIEQKVYPRRQYYECDFVFFIGKEIGIIELNGNSHNNRYDYDQKKRRDLILYCNNIRAFDYCSNNDNYDIVLTVFFKTWLGAEWKTVLNQEIATIFKKEMEFLYQQSQKLAEKCTGEIVLIEKQPEIVNTVSKIIINRSELPQYDDNDDVCPF